MKNICFLCVFLFAFTALQAKDKKVIEKPYFNAWSSSELEIEKVTLTRDTTFLDITLYGSPAAKVNVNDAALLRSGEHSYVMYGKEGLPSDKEWVLIPDNGVYRARIKFAPLPVDAESFDFIEAPENGWNIYGISLTGKKPVVSLPDNLKNQKFTTDDAWPSTQLKSGKSIIRGHILGYNPSAGSKLTFSNTNWLNSKLSDNEVTINPDGTFRIESNPVTLSCVRLRYGSNFIKIYNTPGGEVSVTIDAPSSHLSSSHQFKEEYAGVPCVWFEGNYARLNTELERGGYKTSITETPDFYKRICGITPIEYKKVCLDWLENTKSIIRNDKQIGETTRRLLLLNLDMEMFSVLTSHKLMLTYAPLLAKKADVKPVADMSIPDTYYNEMLQFDFIHSPDAVLGDKYTSYVMSAQRLFKDKITPVQPLWQDIALMAKVMKGLTDLQPLEGALLATADSIRTPEIRENLNGVNAIVLAKLENVKSKTGYTVLQLDPDVTEEQLFSAIVAPFAGKVVLLDFWATWCAPCRQAMKSILPLKEQFKDKNVVFLYVTGETSPEGTWKVAIADIHGTHYRLTQKQWSYLMKKYDIKGIPAYLVIDGKGNVTYQNIGFPGEEILKEEIDKVL